MDFIGGNNITEENGTAPFEINQSTGELFTAATLDREDVSSYDLCVTVSNSPPAEQTTNPSSTRGKRSVVLDDLSSTLKVKVYIEDEDDHGPRFVTPEAGYFTAGLYL